MRERNNGATIVLITVQFQNVYGDYFYGGVFFLLHLKKKLVFIATASFMHQPHIQRMNENSKQLKAAYARTYEVLKTLFLHSIFVMKSSRGNGAQI